MTATKSSTITWTAGTDNCQVTGYQTYVGTTVGGEEVVVAQMIPSSAALTSYQIEDGVDGFTIAVTSDTDTDHYTSLKTMDAAGNLSAVETSTAWGAIYESCNELYTVGGVTTDGVYTIDPDGFGPKAPFMAYCDMTSCGGGWTLVLNYLRAGGTNPALNILTNRTPLLGSTTCLLYTSPSPRDKRQSRMPSSA